MTCVFLSMWWLHIGTYYYVHQMEDMERMYIVNETAVKESSNANVKFPSPGIWPQNISYGSLLDISEKSLGWQSINMGFLDMIAAALPISWFFVTILTDDIMLWTKAILCNCFLLTLKGLFGFMTIVPDSIGWSQCKQRLTPEGIELMKDMIGGPEQGFFSVFFTTMKFEVKSRLPPNKPSGVRFCADMMPSGHTFFTCLYALALLEKMRRGVRTIKKFGNWLLGPSYGKYLFWVVFGFVMFVAVTEQTVELYYVVLNRFHYMMDVVMAIVLTLLFYTNGTITIVSKIWKYWDFTCVGFLKDPFGDVLLKDFNNTVAQTVKDAGGKPHGVGGLDDMTQEFYDEYKWSSLSDGDTWTPMCCFPFCCFMGKYHLLSDHTWYQLRGKKCAPNAWMQVGDDEHFDNQDGQEGDLRQIFMKDN